MTHSRITFGAWLRGRRAEKNQTQEQTAEAIGVGPKTLAGWEAERALPIKILDVIQVAEWASVEKEVVFELVAGDYKILLAEITTRAV